MVSIDDKSLIKRSLSVPDDRTITDELHKRVIEDSAVFLVYSPDWGITLYIIRNDFIPIDYSDDSIFFVSNNVDIRMFDDSTRVYTIDDDLKETIIMNADSTYMSVNLDEDSGEIYEISFAPPTAGTGELLTERVLEDGFIDLMVSYRGYVDEDTE